jgi:LuxR family maltose regulon positive regulatory protein
MGSGRSRRSTSRLSAVVDQLQRAGHLSDVLGCSITLAEIRSVQGYLGDALRTFERGLRLAATERGTVLRGTADMHVGISQIACERGGLPTAMHHLRRSREFGEQKGLPQNAYRWRVAMARVLESQGDLTAALALLDEAQRL